jgi:16S rRNA (guanine966-N2)-methyltransferase
VERTVRARGGRGSLRVIAGRLKGRRLKAPAWEGLRPTSDKLRETLFNILAPRLARARVLDGYAGTGAVGIEALSRGAAHVTFVERDRRAVALIRENLAGCGIEADYTIQAGDFVALIARRGQPGGFDLVLLDPPYDAPDVRGALDAAGRVLAPDGTIVLEHATRREIDVPPALREVRRVTSGDSTLTFFVPR